MARTLHRLSDRTVKAAKPGMYCDGGNLYLQVTAGPDGVLADPGCSVMPRVRSLPHAPANNGMLNGRWGLAAILQSASPRHA